MKRKLIHWIGNDVTKQFVADAITAYGATPIMSVTPEDFETFYQHVDALGVSIGTLSENQKSNILKACKLANAYKVPICIDAVGIQLSAYRKAFLLTLISQFKIDVIKGNQDEIASLGTALHYDSFDAVLGLTETAILTLTTHYPDLTFIATGAEDVLLQKGHIKKITGGSSLLPKISGTGCVLGGLIASELGMKRTPFNSVLAATEKFKRASELAEHASKKRLGQFKIELLSELEALL